ncbi:MAG: TIGR00725 family protein [Dehalococcoidia bacterium]|nr:TIGR00725 family protein [Dehalococcoidia bacterium]
MNNRKFISVIGASQASASELALAEAAGKEIAHAGAVLVCGGMGGVMEAACRGAKSVGGTTIGILPGNHRGEGNPYLDFPIASGVGHARNVAVVKTGQAVIAVGGSYGTLTEIGYALNAGLPVIGLESWTISRKGRGKCPIISATTPAEAVKMALEMID